ncbi:hypothetical protein [Peribacillus sp. SCS-155]|uniref:hypothetical protein n=1 Tax=Peribacillus sedimenti TaxID=3115297 RepID=UPI003906091A
MDSLAWKPGESPGTVASGRGRAIFFAWFIGQSCRVLKERILEALYIYGSHFYLRTTIRLHSQDLKRFVNGILKKGAIVDPSAANFKAQLKQGRWHVIDARNDMMGGIKNVASALKQMLILNNDCCKETFREYSSYVWD